MEITQEKLEQLLCAPLGSCFEGEGGDAAFALHLEIAKSKIVKLLGYDIFALAANSPTTFTIPYDSETQYFHLPPFSSLISVSIVTCEGEQQVDLGCEWKPVTRDLVYTAECHNALEHCENACGCKPRDCSCDDCQQLVIEAEWCLPPEICLLIAQMLQKKCDDNVKKKSIDGFSVEYFDKTNPLDEFTNTLECYSLIEDLDVL